MKAQSKFAATVALLAALATLPAMLIAFRCIVDKMMATAPHFTAPIQEAEFWARGFGF